MLHIGTLPSITFPKVKNLAEDFITKNLSDMVYIMMSFLIPSFITSTNIADHADFVFKIKNIHSLAHLDHIELQFMDPQCCQSECTQVMAPL